VIEIRGLRLTLGEFRLRDIALDVAEGEYFVLLGPTGAGKTVLLECLVGIHSPEAGRIRLDGADVTQAPPEKRGIAYVPQDYCLFPNLTARGNIAYGLDGRGRPQTEVDARVDELADWLAIRPILSRRPLTLSGGEKQRVALARALAVRPRLLLLDEPLAAVDPATRDDVCAELKSIQRRGRTTVIHVCHNFEEALTVADRIGVMRDGRIVQAGTPRDIFRRPESVFVAGFTGAANILSTAWADGVAVAGGIRLPAPVRAPGRGWVVFRPEDVDVRPAGSETEAAEGTDFARLSGFVTTKADRGPYIRLEILADGKSFVAAVSPRDERAGGLAEGDAAEVRLPHDKAVFILEPAGEA
jgi:ABC-type Fe3+/spermidine/putrescine transport system ATPase subunit